MYKNLGVRTPAQTFNKFAYKRNKHRATTSFDQKREKVFNREVQSKSSYRSRPFDKAKFIQELKDKENRKSMVIFGTYNLSILIVKKSTKVILGKRDKLITTLLGYKPLMDSD